MTGPGTIRAKVRERIRWKLYRRDRFVRWKHWDATFARPGVCARVDESRVYYTETPSVLAGDRLQLLSTGSDAAANREYAYRIQAPGGAYVEPDCGYALTADGVLIEHSLSAEQELARQPALWGTFSGVPSPREFAVVAQGDYEDIAELGRAASMRFVFERNYFHLLFEGFAKLHMFEQLGMPSDTPIIVSARLMAQPYMQAMVQRGRLADRHWVVQSPTTYVHADELWCGRVNWECREHTDYVLDLMDVQPDPRGDRRIFLTRSTARGRNLTNSDEIMSVLARHDVEVIDADGLAHEEQVRIFGAATTVIGLHGAGLANIIFRRGLPLRLIEIQPPTELPLAFYTICKQYGYQYQYITGVADPGATPRGRETSYRLDPALLEETLRNLGPRSTG